MAKLTLPYVHEYRDRHGKARRYLRRRGCPRVSLPGIPGSAEFMAAYQAGLGSKAEPQSKHGPRSFAQLVTAYYRSVLFANLKPSSQTTYRRAIEPLREKHGHRLVADMPREKVTKIIEEIGATRKGMANLTKSVLHVLMSYAVEEGWRPDNPVRVKDYRGGTRHTWTDEEMATYEAKWPLGTRQRLAYAALLYTGQRRGDAVKMLRPARGAPIQLVQQKTGEDDIVMTIAVHPALWQAIKAGPSLGLYLIHDTKGKPITGHELTAFLRIAIREAGLPPRCKPHGLRKAIMRRLAERGASTKELQAVSGHRTLKEVQRYTEAADQAKLNKAALSKIK